MSGYKTRLNQGAKKLDLLYTLSEEESTRLKKTLLIIYDDIADVCKKHKISPILIGGSALGAVRHKGFIPWDDDLDLAMERSEYEKFLDVFEHEMGDRYSLMSPGRTEYVDNRFTQIYLKGTIYKMLDDNERKPQGIYVDLFPIDFVPENRLMRLWKGCRSYMLMTIAMCAGLYQIRNETMVRFMSSTKRIYLSYRMKQLIGFAFSWRKCEKWFEILDKRIQYKRTGLCGVLVDVGHYFGEIKKSELYFPYAEETFEGRTVKVPHDVHQYLEQFYGSDYMIVPPEGKRERHFITELKLPDFV